MQDSGGGYKCDTDGGPFSPLYLSFLSFDGKEEVTTFMLIAATYDSIASEISSNDQVLREM